MKNGLIALSFVLATLTPTIANSAPKTAPVVDAKAVSELVMTSEFTYQTQQMPEYLEVMKTLDPVAGGDPVPPILDLLCSLGFLQYCVYD